MMKSMTGYGRGECTAKGASITVELNSVNRKQAEVSLSVPSELESIEPDLRDLILASVSRGRVSGRVVLQYTGSSRASAGAVNETQAKAYRRELSKLAKSLEIPDNLSMEGLLRLPGVLENTQPTLDAKAFRAPIKSALGQAPGQAAPHR